jgi:hypothetical protein
MGYAGIAGTGQWQQQLLVFHTLGKQVGRSKISYSNNFGITNYRPLCN